MASEGKFILKAVNNISEGVNSAKQDLSGFAGSVAKLGKTIKTAINVTAVVAAVKAIGDAALECGKGFNEAERAYSQMALALGDSTSFNNAISTVNELSRVSMSSKAEIRGMVSELAALGLKDQEINKISRAASALATVTGKDLNGAMELMLDSLNGSTGELEKYGLDVKNLTEDELAQGAAIDVVIGAYETYATTLADQDTNQHLKNIKDTWEDVKIAVGGIIDAQFGPFIANLDTAFVALKENITTVIATVAAIIQNFPQVFSLTMNVIWQLIKKTFEWDSLKTIFIAVVKNIGILIEALFKSVPTALLSLGKGILNYATYLILNIKNSIVQGFEDAINWVTGKITNTWIGKLFGLQGKWQVDFSGGMSDTSKFKDRADSNFENAGGSFVQAVEDAGTAMKEVADNTADTLEGLYGEITGEYISKVQEIIEPAVTELKENTSATNAANNLIPTPGTTTTAGDGTTTDGGGTTTDGGDGTTTDGGGDETPAAAITRSIEEENPWETLGNTFMSSFQPLINLVKSPWITMVEQIVKGFVEVVGPAVDSFIKPLFDSLQILGNCIGNVITPIFEALTPVMQFFGKIVIYVAGTIQWVANWVRYIFIGLENWLHSISIFGWHPFGEGQKPNEKPKGWKETIDEMMGDFNKGTSTNSDAGTQTAVQNASYSGSTSITVNIYQNAAVVGEGGMEEFALMIKDTLYDLDRSGR